MAEADIGHGIEGAAADDAQKKYDAPIAFYLRPVFAGLLIGKGGKDQGGEAPAQARQGDGGDVIGYATSKHEIAAPEKRCQRHQDISIVV